MHFTHFFKRLINFLFGKNKEKLTGTIKFLIEKNALVLLYQAGTNIFFMQQVQNLVILKDCMMAH